MTRADRIRRHLEWLRGLYDDAVISKAVYQASALSWDEIDQESVGKMPVPDIGLVADGAVFYSWRRGEHRLDLDLNYGEPNEWFYKNYETDETMYNDEYRPGNPFPEWVENKMKLFYGEESCT